MTESNYRTLTKKEIVSKDLASPQIITQPYHHISHSHISKNALSVIRRLHAADYEAYLVGGSVRDLLLGNKPKDFDVATNARPEKIRELFKNCRLIGRRFKLAHVFFGREIIEVATFRRSHPEQDHPDAYHSETGLLVRDNVYGTLRDDAWRRDFSINALYYNPANHSVVDYVDGMTDLEKRIIRILGDPQVRYTEDPIRMLRSLRFAAKLSFTLEEKTAAPISTMRTLLTQVPSARLFTEILKFFYCGQAVQAIKLAREFQIFELLFPQTHQAISYQENKAQYLTFLSKSCESTDERINQDLSLNPGFLFAALLWPALQMYIHHYTKQGAKPYVAFEKSMQELVSQQLKIVAIPKRYTAIMREIWVLQRIMEKKKHNKIDWITAHSRFRAAYDFLVLRWISGEEFLEPVVSKWKIYKK